MEKNEKKMRKKSKWEWNEADRKTDKWNLQKKTKSEKDWILRRDKMQRSRWEKNVQLPHSPRTVNSDVFNKVPIKIKTNLNLREENTS